MAISLESVIKGKEAKPPRILIYGTDGVGKSSWAADAPNPIFTQTEDRLSHINASKFPLCESYADALQTLRVLYTEEHEYKTHVTDSADWLEKLVHKELCAKHGEDSIVSNAKGSPFSYGRGHVMAEQEFRRYVNGLEALRNAKNMTIIVIAHAVIKRFEDPMRDSYDTYKPALHDRCAALLQQWADCVLFCNFEALVRSEKSEFNKEQKKAIGTGRRILYSEERPAFEAKNSYDLPPEIPMPKDGPYQPFAEMIAAYMNGGSDGE